MQNKSSIGAQLASLGAIRWGHVKRWCQNPKTRVRTFLIIKCQPLMLFELHGIHLKGNFISFHFLTLKLKLLNPTLSNCSKSNCSPFDFKAQKVPFANEIRKNVVWTNCRPRLGLFTVKRISLWPEHFFSGERFFRFFVIFAQFSPCKATTP
jgi:hypothetical protein